MFETAVLEGIIEIEKKYIPLIEEERRQKEEAKQKEKAAMLKLATKMKKYGEPIDDILRETGLSRGEVEGL